MRHKPFYLLTTLSRSPTLHQLRHSSTSPPLINIRNIPAPHCGHIRILSLNNPKSRNAISRALLADLARHITDIHNEGPQGPTRALIIASDVDAAFCAGADLKERRGFTREETTSFLTLLRFSFTSITALPLPTLTALSSLALGGGLELALTTDLRILASTASLGLPETRLGIIPGAGGCWRLVQRLGGMRGRALDMVLTGRRVGGREAWEWGLGERCVDVDVEGGGGDGYGYGYGGGVGQEGSRDGVEIGLDGKDIGITKEAMARRAREMVLQEAIDVAWSICEGGPLATKAALRAVKGLGGGAGRVEVEGVGKEEMIGKTSKANREEELENSEYEAVVKSEDRDEALRAFGEKRRPVFKGR